MNNIIIIQARFNSSRLKGKIFKKLNGYSVLQWVVESANKVKEIDKVIVATTNSQEDDKTSQWCKDNNVLCFRGDEKNVMKRFVDITKKYKPKNIVRLTADCPFIDSSIIDDLFLLKKLQVANYVSNFLLPSWPDGLDCEIFDSSTLLDAYKYSKKQSDLEHVTPSIYNRKTKYKCINLPCPFGDLSNLRITLDNSNDYKNLSKMSKYLSFSPSYVDTIKVYNEVNPKVRNKRNEGYIKSLEEDKMNENTNFSNSNLIFTKTKKIIPLASQTFSKSFLQLPYKSSPLFTTHGVGSSFWDVDGNNYIDMSMCLLSVILGYADQDVNEAIKNQMVNGINFSIASTLEKELAELLTQIIPSAEMVRYGKNGSDVTAGAIRLSRYVTGKDRIIACGYHGWQDWYIGSTSFSNGVPKSVSNLTHLVPYNDFEAIEILLNKYPNQIAAIILEPMNVEFPKNDFLKKVRKITKKRNIILIFDEICTGFRFSLGGAQEIFGVVPDLTCLGKSMGNGMPISALVGLKKIMKQTENIFFSSTHGGESLSLAAALATIKKIRKEKVCQSLKDKGLFLNNEVENLIKKYKLSKVISLRGHPSWKILIFEDFRNITKEAIKTFVLKEMIARGVFIVAGHNISFSHSKEDLKLVIKAYDETFLKLAHTMKKNDQNLFFKPFIEPIFKVR